MAALSLVNPVNREAIYAALFAKVWAAYQWKNDKNTARRLKLWNEVAPQMRPALFQFEGGNETYTYTQNPNPFRVLEASLFIYTACKDPAIIGSDLLMPPLDAVEGALLPTVIDSMGAGGARQTLGGLVHNCRIEGTVFKDPGDLDGDGMVRIPLKIIIP